MHHFTPTTMMPSFRLLWTFAVTLLLLPTCSYCLSFSRVVPAPTRIRSSFSLAAVSQSQVAALDGAEWSSLQLHLMASNRIPRGRLSEVGRMTIITGTLPKTNERVVGIQAEDTDDDTISLDDSTFLYKDSMATIPKQVKEQDAMTTLLASLVGVHCVLPAVEEIGGSDSDSFVSGKVVVMGGSDYACFAAEALAACGASVVQVSTGSPNIKNSNIETVSPAVGELDLGFADVVGEFDALLDTMSDEAKLTGMRVEESDVIEELATSGVVAELRKQHQCSRYVSTMSQSQRIIWNEGVLWGPKKASLHINNLTPKTATSQSIVPPRNFSSTLQTLLDKGITWKQKKEGNTLVRGWSLKDFWQLSSWPRDSAGTGDTRYGLPVVDVDRMLEERFSKKKMVAEPPSIKGSAGKFQNEEQQARQAQTKADANNPYVMSVHGVEGLQRDIIAAEKDCLLFLSAPWCRTCRYLSPGYTRMARETSVEVTFAKADATGNIGKALGKALEVNAVPAFVLFRQGEVFGSPLSVSRLPSRKLEQAVDCLASGMEWDDSLLDEEDE